LRVGFCRRQRARDSDEREDQTGDLVMGKTLAAMSRQGWQGCKPDFPRVEASLGCGESVGRKAGSGWEEWVNFLIVVHWPGRVCL